MSNLKVQVGQPVQYIGLSQEPQAAQVTKVNANGTANLVVFVDGLNEASFAKDVPVFVDTFDARKTDQSYAYKVIRF